MRLFSFGRDVAATLTAHGSRDAALSRVARVEGRVQVAVVHLAAGGALGRHPAVVNQLFLVVAGSGGVAGDDGIPLPISPGRAAFWVAGEEHGATSENGLIAVVVEAANLDPAPFMAPA